MIFKILEYNYKGFHLVLDEADPGWKCIIGEKEIRFRTSQDAESAINEILKDADKAIEQHKGIPVCKVPGCLVTKTVETEKPY